MKNICNKILLILLGGIVFSPISSIITMDFLKLPLALPELLFIPFYFLLRNSLDLKVIITRHILWIFYFFMVLLGISFILLNFPFGSILSIARGYFYMLLSYTIFRRQNQTSTLDIMWISLGSVVAWCILSVMQFRMLVTAGTVDGSLAVSGNMVALSLLIAIAFIKQQTKLIILVVFLCVVLSLTTGLRRQILIFIISLFFSVILLTLGNLKKSSKTIFILFLLSLGIFYYYSSIETAIKDVSPLLHLRIFHKSEQLVTGELSQSDQIRTTSILEFYKNISEYFVPRGFVSKRTLSDNGTGIFMDSPIIELAYMLGIIILPIFLIHYLKFIYNHLKIYFKNRVNESAIWATAGFVLFALLFIEGSFLNYAYITPFTGLVLGKLSSSKLLV